MEEEDNAERLHGLIEKLKEIASTETIHVSQKNSSYSVNDVALWQTLNFIAQKVGLKDDLVLRDAFVSLCDSVQFEVRSIPIRKESVRIAWLSRLEDISKVFTAKNFGLSTRDAFNNHFTTANLETLDSISERFRAVGIKESSPAELEEALDAVRNVIEALSLSGDLDMRIAAVLSHYLQQMETVYAQVNDFGDEVFWKIYKETFATFLQIHPIIVGLENAAEVKSKLQVMMEKLTSKSIAGVSLGANIATLGTALYPLLGTG